MVIQTAGEELEHLGIELVLLQQPPGGEQQRRQTHEVKHRGLNPLAGEQIRAHTHRHSIVLRPDLELEPHLQACQLHELAALGELQFPDLVGQTAVLHVEPAQPQRLDERRYGLAQVC